VSVEDTDSIDILSFGEQSGDVILTVTDHLDFCDSLRHQAILQAKLNAYLLFVESGEIFLSHPHARDRPIMISVIF
jgi:hypothetical protein